MPWTFPKIYPILDSSVIPAEGRKEFLLRLGCELADAGVTLLEYRNKTGEVTELIADAAILRASMHDPGIKLILDDRVDLVEVMGFDGVHVDAGDVSPAEARRLLTPRHIVGTFGGTEAIVPGILDQPADYFSIGPIGVTQTKQTTKPPIGAAGVRNLRAQAGPKPVLVAAGGVTIENAAEILAAGASTVAVSAAIFRTTDPAAEFRRWKEQLG
jgi:thiamine-phosphate pyrophosphorylase